VQGLAVVHDAVAASARRAEAAGGCALDAARAVAPGVPVIMMSTPCGEPGDGGVVPNDMLTMALKVAVERAVVRAH